MLPYHRAKRIRLLLAAAVFFVLGFFSWNRDGLVEGITLYKPVNLGNNFYTLYVGKGKTGVGTHSRGVFRAASDGPTEFRLNSPVSPLTGRQLFVQMGRTYQAHHVSGLSYDAVLFYWHVPLVTYSGSKLTQVMHPVAGRSVFSSQSDSEVSVKSIAPNGLAYVQVDFSAADVLAGVPRWKILAIKSLRLLKALIVSLAVYFLPWLLSRSKGFIDDFLALFTQPSAIESECRISRQNNRFWMIVGSVLLLLLAAVRSWANFTHPGLYVEDSLHYFNYYFGGHQPLADILRKPNQYIVLGTNFIAWLVARLDVEWQPYVYLGFSILFAWISASMIAFSGLFRNRYVILLAPALLGLVGFNHLYYWVTLTYQIFNAVILLLALMYFPTPETSLRKAGWIFFVTLLIWSGPYSVLALPLALLMLAFRMYPAKRYLLFYVMVCVLFYYTTLNGGTTDIFALFRNDVRQVHFVSLLFEQVWFMGWFGALTVGKVVLWLCAMTGVFYTMRKDLDYLRVSLSFLMISVVNLAIYFMSSKYMTIDYWPNHIFISQYFWLVFILYTFDRATVRFHLGRRWSLVFLAFFSVVIYADNAANPEKRYKKIQTHIPYFLHTIKHYQQREAALTKQNKKLLIQAPAYNFVIGPTVVLGSKAADARQIGSREIGDDYGKEFIQPPRPAEATPRHR